MALRLSRLFGKTDAAQAIKTEVDRIEPLSAAYQARRADRPEDRGELPTTASLQLNPRPRHERDAIIGASPFPGASDPAT